jgi:LmbE family N-acetylglucosaminyl deacetylase
LKAVSVLTHPYEGGHPDHDATAFAVHAAVALMSRPARIFEFTSYHDGGGSIVTGEFLGAAEDSLTVDLSVPQRQRKRRMIECFATQQHMLQLFPLGVEKFRPAPAYDFTKLPHAGTLYYERFDWGMTGARWVRLASRALDELGLKTKTS